MLLVPLLVWALGPASIAAHVSLEGNSSQTATSDEIHIDSHEILKRNADIRARLSQSPIQGMKKMSNDEGEKFFLDYWRFDEGQLSTANSTEPHETQLPGQTEKISDIQPRVFPHNPSLPLDPKRSPGSHGWMENASPLFRRDFKCPSGTSSCASIDRPDSCCSTGETCELVRDTGSGDVGCCPQGQQCSGTIGTCKQGYTSCPASLGGGCCIPGYKCVSGGCANVFTVTITLSSTVMISTSTQTIPATTTQSTSSTSTSTSTSSKKTSSTSDLAPPARPTSLSTATASKSEDICPIGFYGCSAVYHGGCCQTGRDCDTTSCPPTPSTTITTNDRTIVVPVETTTGTGGTTGERCAHGWFSCADTVGGGCCPTGYACGSSCTAVATATATGTVAKEEPTNEASRKSAGMMKVLGVGVMGMIWTI